MRGFGAFVVLAVLLVSGAAGCGGSDGDDDAAAPTATLRRSTTTTASTVPAAAGDEDFTEILRDLLARRDEAYEKNDVTILESIYSTQCACLANGRRVIEERRREGVHTEGERLHLLRAEVASRVSDDLVFIRGVVSQGPTQLVDRTGTVIRPGETHGPISLIYETRKAPTGWLILGITEEGPVEP